MARNIRSRNKTVPLNFKSLKKKYDDIPSHFLFSIEDPLDYQCPSIDEYIEKIQNCKSLLKEAFESKNEETKNAKILNAFFSIHNIDNDLDEKTRANFIKIRDYASQWKKLAIDCIDRSGNPEKYVKINWD